MNGSESPLSGRVNLPVSALLKVPRQERSIATVVAILDAAVFVLNSAESTAFTTNRVAEVAGVSIGTLYQYFTNKETLLAGVLERGVLNTEDTLRGMTVTPEGPLEDSIRTILTAVVASLEPYGRLLNVILSTSPMLSRNGILPLLEPRLTSAVHVFLLTRTDVRVHGAGASFYVGVNSTIVTVLRWLAERPPWLPREQLVDALARQCLAHLRTT